jgi:hypothetical protein
MACSIVRSFPWVSCKGECACLSKEYSDALACGQPISIHPIAHGFERVLQVDVGVSGRGRGASHFLTSTSFGLIPGRSESNSFATLFSTAAKRIHDVDDSRWKLVKLVGVSSLGSA